MIDPTIDARFWDFILFGVFTGLMPAWTTLVTLPRIRKLSPERLSRIRLSLYIQAMALQWVLIGVALHPLVWRGAEPAQLGLSVTLPMLPRLAVGLGLVTLGLLALASQRRGIMRLPEGRAIVRDAVQRFAWLLPRTRGERIMWIFVSLHAGIGEELFFRGYVFGVLNSLGPWWAAALLGSFMFGMGHTYQGVRGVASTAFLGLMAIGLYLLTGSIWVGMLVHALYDIHGGEFGRWALHENDQPTASNA